MFAIADCNNFYASCERVFQPHLNGKPIVVLSNNDGCVIARSNEAKRLQVAMGVPYFKIEKYAQQEGITVFSSNYALYGDLSRRVMQVLAEFAPRVEVYSIDECFLDFSGLPFDLSEYSQHICTTVKKWTGIPISIGIAPTKTLAKLANRLAKKGASAQGAVLDWQTLDNPSAVLETMALDDIWGISRRWSKKLMALGINNARALRDAEPKHMRQQFGVVMESIVNELRGISCISLADIPQPNKQIMTSRSFGVRLTSYPDLLAAVTHFATRAAEKLRKQNLATQALIVFVETSRFDSQSQYANSAIHVFDLPTSDTAQLIQAAQRGLQKIFKTGFSYQRAGILLPDLLPVGVAQMSLFEDSALSERSEHLMVALDSINRKHGKQTICYGNELLSKHWRRRQQFKSPSYTTNWQEVLTICI
ncbi:Y-family DNA polymerase [Methylomonas sp. AM2-LC]|uniref:Y-family DNA polymerase n=1 Tax=Methylomonas sp. AM2-LC TaxID=3153301 RepID=UPI0032650E99